MHVALRPEQLSILSICTGGAGLDLGVELAIPSARTVCMVEREAFAVATLVSAMEEGLLHPAPIWSDARTFDGRAWRGAVDGLIGGIPCQPHSHAGKKRGQHDERDLWSDTRRRIVQSRVWFVFIENVGGMLSAGDDEIAGAQRVFRDLHKLGFEVEGGLFKASEVGAPHGRERIFILAVADSLGFIQSGGRSGEVQTACCAPEGEARFRERSGDDIGDRGECLSGVGLADSCGPRLQRGEFGGAPRSGNWSEASGSTTELRCSPLADTSGSRYDWRQDGEIGLSIERVAPEGASRGLERPMGDSNSLREFEPYNEDGTVSRNIAWRRSGRASSRSVSALGDASIARGRAVSIQPRGQVETCCDFDRPSLFPPGPSDGDAWRAVLERSPHLEPSVRRMADGVGSHVDELRMLGNGVVPLQAAYALRTLATRLAARGSARAARLVRMMEVD